jgi:hypothetical protein
MPELRVLYPESFFRRPFWAALTAYEESWGRQPNTYSLSFGEKSS